MDKNFYYDQIKDSVLEVIEAGEKVKAFRLRKYPNRTMMSCDLVFLPGRIILTGDLRVDGNGVIALGYGLEWFADQHNDPDYLASKFLQTKWCPDQARAYWCDVLEQYKAEWAQYQEEEKERRQIHEEANAELEEKEEYIPEVPDHKLLRNAEWRIDHFKFKGTVIDALEYLLAEDGGDEYFQDSSELYRAIPAYFNGSHWICPFDTSEGLGGNGYDEHEVGWLYAIQRRFSECYAHYQEIKNSCPVFGIYGEIPY